VGAARAARSAAARSPANATARSPTNAARCAFPAGNRCYLAGFLGRSRMRTAGARRGKMLGHVTPIKLLTKFSVVSLDDAQRALQTAKFGHDFPRPTVKLVTLCI
jgi:hypothetical protein